MLALMVQRRPSSVGPKLQGRPGHGTGKPEEQFGGGEGAAQWNRGGQTIVVDTIPRMEGRLGGEPLPFKG